ncbi:helix-turn-helix domain-containing protein [Falsiroseomonas sp. CW058]|uniref:helix-turn-helix domain-containing protein n=1 Tax=Falsiroseomonas sp. CW058 TaxID=3388664 RepID=UPI003D317AFF
MVHLRPTSFASAADQHVGRRIRERRLQRGLSLAEVAQGIGVSTQQARKYEAGRNGVPAGRLVALGDLLGVTPCWFFDGMEAGFYRPLLPTRPRMLLDLVRTGEALPEPGLAALCAAARALAPDPRRRNRRSGESAAQTGAAARSMEVDRAVASDA